MGDRFIAVIRNRWYALAVFIAACASGFVWYTEPTAPWWLAFATCGAILLLAFSRETRKRTIPWAVHLAVGLFMLAAAWNVWAAYNPDVAVDKFQNLLGAVFLFYAVAYQPKENVVGVLAVISSIGSVVSAYFILTYDWQVHPTDIGLVNKIGTAWMNMRFALPFTPMSDDIAGGIFAILTPLAVGLFICARKRKKPVAIIFSLFAALIILIGLFLAGVRASWGGLAAGILLAMMLVVVQKAVGRYLPRAMAAAAIAIMLLVMVGIAVAIGVIAGEIMPSMQSSVFLREMQSRSDLYRDALALAGSYYWIGGGLGAFAGLYSRYVRSIPDYSIAYSHNLYLDITIEQGIIGLAAFTTIVLAGMWLLTSRRYSSFRSGGEEAEKLHVFVLIGLLTMLMQGILENSLHGMRATPFFLLLPGLAFLIQDQRQHGLTGFISTWYRTRWVIAGTGGVGVIIVILLFNRPLAADLYANLGSIELAKTELAGWPEKRAASHIYTDGGLDKAIQYLDQALSFEPQNRTANYQLGRIAMERRDFQQAIIYFEHAFASDEQHHGIRKNLGYSYVFTGQIDAARRVLAEVNEARYDMEIYQWWWGTQGRDDLVLYAKQFLE